MAVIITDDCINCGACAVECPTEAIFELGQKYELYGKKNLPISTEHFFIVTEICTECSGLNEFKCIAICPMDAIKKELI